MIKYDSYIKKQAHEKVIMMKMEIHKDTPMIPFIGHRVALPLLARDL